MYVRLLKTSIELSTFPLDTIDFGFIFNEFFIKKFKVDNQRFKNKKYCFPINALLVTLKKLLNFTAIKRYDVLI